jgi:hypothetical protein
MAKAVAARFGISMMVVLIIVVAVLKLGATRQPSQQPKGDQCTCTEKLVIGSNPQTYVLNCVCMTKQCVAVVAGANSPAMVSTAIDCFE